MADEGYMNLVQRLAKIREMVEVLRKNKSGYNYKYVTEDEILARVAAGMKKYGVSLEPSFVPGTMAVSTVHFKKTKMDKSKNLIEEDVNETLVHAELKYVWVNNDDTTDRIEIPWAMVGQQGDASQAMGSALTYANRYFLLKFFQVATPDDDPDKWKGKKQNADAEADLAEAIAMTKPIVTKIDAHVRAYMDTNGNSKEARKKVVSLIQKYVKDENGDPSADYMNNLVDPKVAAKLLDDLQKTVPIENGANNSNSGGDN